MSTILSPLSVTFLGITLLCCYLFVRAHAAPGKLLWLLLGYALLQFSVGASGFYENVSVLPPRFILNILPSIVAIVWLFSSQSGQGFLAGFDRQKLLLLHSVRFPVELVLFGLFVRGEIPQIMTFEGNNFDIVMGLTAPIIWYFGYQYKLLSPGMIKAWHIVGLILLLNIVITALLAAPLPFQQIAFEQPNVGVLKAPFNLLPALVVPLVFTAHFIGLRKTKIHA